MKRFPADADGTGLWTIVAQFFHKGDFSIEVNFIEAAIENGVTVEVNAAALRCFQKPIVLKGEQF